MIETVAVVIAYVWGMVMFSRINNELKDLPESFEIR